MGIILRQPLSDRRITELLNNIPDYNTRRVLEELMAQNKLQSAEPRWDDFAVDISRALPSAAYPDIVQVDDNGSGSTGVFAYGFDAATEQSVHFNIQLPHRYMPGTDIYPHIHCTKIAAGNAGNVIWGLEYEVFDDLSPATGSVIIKTTAAPLTTLQESILYFPKIAGSSFAESHVLLCRFFRAAADAGDTLSVDAIALSFDVHYQVNKSGTYTQDPVQG